MTWRPTIRDCRDGRMMFDPTDAYIGRSLDLYGEFSPAEGDVYRQIVRPGQVVVDAGAHIGCFTLLFAHAVGTSGHVIAFEPQRPVFQMLCGNLALNGLTHVEARQAGLGAGVGEAVMPVIPFGEGRNSGAPGLRPDGPGDRVPVLPLDALNLPRLDFLKADIQGMEGEMLDGATDTLRRCQPILSIENEEPETSQALIERLFSLDYRVFKLVVPLYRKRNFRHLAENHFEGLGSFNMLCLPSASNRDVRGLPEIKEPSEWPVPNRRR